MARRLPFSGEQYWNACKRNAFKGALMYTYEAGTTTALKTTWTTADAAVAHKNPVQADSNGIFPEVYGSGSYYIEILNNAEDEIVYQADNITGVGINTESVIPFDTVALMVAEPSLNLGDLVLVEDYAIGNNSGVLYFKVVPAATGTADGGSYIDLPNTDIPYQAEQILGNVINFSKFGAKANDLTTDSGAAISAAIAAWLATLTSGYPSVLTGNPGSYRSDNIFDIQLPHPVTRGAVWNMKGVSIFSYSASSSDFISFASNGTCRGLNVLDLTIDGNNSSNHADMLSLDGGDPGATTTEFLYNCSLNRVNIEGAPKGGYHWKNNVFESSDTDCHGESRDLATYFVKQISKITGQPSSLEFYGGSTRGGVNGFKAQSGSGDILISGGTYIESGEHAISMIDQISMTINGSHVENAWKNGVSGNSAGIQAVGSGSINGVFCTSNGNTRTAVEAFADTNGITVSDVKISDLVVDTVAVVAGSNTINTIGIKRANIILPTENEGNNVNVEPDSKLAQLVSSVESGSASHDRDTAGKLEVTLDQDFTLSSVIHPISGDSLEVTTIQDLFGGHAFTFPGDFVVSAAIDTTALKNTIYTFSYRPFFGWYERSRVVL